MAICKALADVESIRNIGVTEKKLFTINHNFGANSNINIRILYLFSQEYSPQCD